MYSVPTIIIKKRNLRIINKIFVQNKITIMDFEIKDNFVPKWLGSRIIKRNGYVQTFI